MPSKGQLYKKEGYTYRESSPGSNKFQNFTAGGAMDKRGNIPSAKKAVPVAKPKPRPAAPVKKAAVSSKPGESSMARTEAMRPTVKAVRDESRMAKAEATRPVTRQSSGPVYRGAMSKQSSGPVPRSTLGQRQAKAARAESKRMTSPSLSSIRSPSEAVTYPFRVLGELGKRLMKKK